MRLTVGFGGAKHLIDDASSTTSVKELKLRLEPLTGLHMGHMRLIVKGKQPEDDVTLGALGVVDGAKLMLMRKGEDTSKRSRPTADSHPQEAGPSVTATDSTFPPKHDAIIAVGDGPITLIVAKGKQIYELRCDQTSTVGELKHMIQSSSGVEPAYQRLLVKGKEPSNGQTVSQLGLAKGGKLMLLFRDGHHREMEGMATLDTAQTELASLEQRWEGLQRKVKKRLLDAAAGIAELGAIEGLLAGLMQDLQNARLSEEGAARRSTQLDAMTRIGTEIEQLKKELTIADLDAQRRT
ncbi:hypothetical protein AB1Y20_000650 [Prymnesium parvum]|uniref:Ubiquitin-like domain-containing protein n=1 Tax=Prymnesium parvum TaxID=97485 RepID=A0AB34KA57_PRYPA